jgi:hypothetical protein
MRKLGSDHSVLFFASNEIRRKIQASIRDERDELDTSDVLIWAMQETLLQIKENGAHWASQGLNFDVRRTAWDKYSKDSSLSPLTKVLQEKESRSLLELYGVTEDNTLHERSVGENGISERQKAIQERCNEFGIALSRSTAILEEQERELAHEKEEERQVERISASSPLDHSPDPALSHFARSGVISASFISLLDCLKDTSQGSSILTTSTRFFQSSELRVTKDFSCTIERAGIGCFMDDFLRPVKWILRSNLKPNFLLLISQFEANVFLQEIRSSKFAQLALYSPRISRQGLCLEDLDFFVVPSSCELTPPTSRIIQELNIFAGQLFFRDRQSFEAACRMLGLHLGVIPDNLKGNVDAVGFVMDETARMSLGIGDCAFHANPLLYLRELLGWRRKGQGFSSTHVGRVLSGKNLGHSEFD